MNKSVVEDIHDDSEVKADDGLVGDVLRGACAF